MYEGDTPNAERRAAALSLDRDLLRELLGQEELRDLIDPAALAQVEEDLQFLSERRRVATRDGLHDVLRTVGDLTAAEAAARVLAGIDADRMLGELVRERRAIKVRLAGEAALHRRRRCGALPRRARRRAPGRASGGVPRGRAGGARAAGPPLRRDATGRSRRRTCTRATASTCSAVLSELERAGELVRGELRPGGSEREWCHPEVLRRLRRASLAVLRKEIEPADQRALARFLPAWQGVDRHPATGAGIDRLRETLVPLQGLALPAEVWERDVLPRRVGAYSPAWMDQLCAAGKSCGSAPARSGATRAAWRCTSARTCRVLGPPPFKGAVPDGPAHALVRARLDRRRVLLHRPARRRRARARGAAGGAVGSRLGGRGDQRCVRAAAGAAADARAGAARAGADARGLAGSLRAGEHRIPRTLGSGPGTLVA